MQTITGYTPAVIDGQPIAPPPDGWQAPFVKALNPNRAYASTRDLPGIILNSVESFTHEGRAYPIAYIALSYGFASGYNRPTGFYMLCSLHRLDKTGFSGGFYSYQSMPLSDGWRYRYAVPTDEVEPKRYTINARAKITALALKNLEPAYNYARTIQI